MRIEGAHGFVLHARRWRETSLLVEVFSLQHGRLGLVARGVQTPKRHALRAALQPLQHISFDATVRGELATLTHAEALDAAPLLTGPALLSGFYINELLLRLLPRHDPHPELYADYAKVRARLDTDAPLGWTLRRFERDLLAALGSGFDYLSDSDGLEIDPNARYRLEPEHGPRRMPDLTGGMGSTGSTDLPGADSISGRTLQALADDQMPAAEELPALRRALRRVLAHHLGPRGLKSWELMAALRSFSHQLEMAQTPE